MIGRILLDIAFFVVGGLWGSFFTFKYVVLPMRKAHTKQLEAISKTIDNIISKSL